ncbi:hypothetical protein FLL84_11120 [Vibrio cholerae]|nr:hypothetical protein FLL84_11120 [Vibrio cholerae]
MVSVVVIKFSGMRCQPLRRALCAFLLNTPSLLIYPKKFRLLHSLCHEFYRMSFGIICPQDADS